MDVLAMKRQGMSFKEIGDELGYHPATIATWYKASGPLAAPTVDDKDRVVDPVWADRLTSLLVGNPKLLANSLFEIIAAEGSRVPIRRWCAGSAPSGARGFGRRMGRRCRARRRPGEEAQFDFSDCSAWAQSVGLGPVLWCFGMILCWSRWRTWWFTTSVDRHHTFEGVARFFDAAGVVPKIARTDRMGALGRSQGRRFQLGPEALEFARYHGVEIKACQAGDAKRKGKVERPFRDLKESFLEELVVTGVPDSIDALKARAQLWVDQRVHTRAHRSTAIFADRQRVCGGHWSLTSTWP